MKLLNKKLEDRKKAGNYRFLKHTPADFTDFSSNDYLGLSKQDLELPKNLSHGSTGSRLLAGNYPLIEQAESEIASFHNAECGLIFNSGYTANLGVFSTIPQKGDTVLYDELIHASIKDGLKLNYANNYSFKHNDLEALQKKLLKAKGTVYVAVEAVYSMDGDCAPIIELVELSKQLNFILIVDEAHSLGVYGVNGEGLINELKADIPIRVVTFGKALGCHGAIVLCNQEVKNYLINFSRPFIYSTALPPYSINVIQESYKKLKEGELTKILRDRISYFNSTKKELGLSDFIQSDSAIHCVLISNTNEIIKLSKIFGNNKLDVKPVFAPTVPSGTERFRICLHTYNSEEEIYNLLSILKKVLL